MRLHMSPMQADMMDMPSQDSLARESVTVKLTLTGPLVLRQFIQPLDGQIATIRKAIGQLLRRKIAAAVKFNLPITLILYAAQTRVNPEPLHFSHMAQYIADRHTVGWLPPHQYQVQLGAGLNKEEVIVGMQAQEVVNNLITQLSFLCQKGAEHIPSGPGLTAFHQPRTANCIFLMNGIKVFFVFYAPLLCSRGET